MLSADKMLGARIREIRTKRGITQKELAGNKITRNMLSLIENGSASPSVSTLMYISEKLETPVGYFFSSSTEDESKFYKLTVIEELKDLFRRKKYAECEELCSSTNIDALDDEMLFILASSYLRTAADHANEYNIRHALDDLEKAYAYCTRSMYCDDAFVRSVMFFRDLIRYSVSEDIPDILCTAADVSEFISPSVIEYFISLRLVKDGQKTPFTFAKNSFYDRHLSSLAMITDEKFSEAQKKLRELALDPALPYYMQYRVLCDLEKTADALGDLRLAYSSSRRKLELIDRFK